MALGTATDKYQLDPRRLNHIHRRQKMAEECAPGTNIERRHCGDHTGQDERIQSVNSKLVLLIWLLGILIAIMVTGIGALFTSINTMNTTSAVAIQKSAGIESRLAVLESAGQRRQEKIMELEYEQRGGK
jgi:hypothetical protein